MIRKPIDHRTLPADPSLLWASLDTETAKFNVMRVTANQVLPLTLEILYYKVESDQESPGQFQLGQVSASSPLTPRSSYFLL